MNQINPLMVEYRVTVSKQLSWLLRHGAVKNNLIVSSDGYISVDDILNTKQFNRLTFDVIQYVVEYDDKKRYDLKQIDNKWCIRANHGHSKQVANQIESGELMKPLFEPQIIIHNTTCEKWEVIKKNGLQKGDRTHVYFATCEENDDYSRMIAIYVDMKKALDDGITFYLASNSLVFSPDVIGVKYFDKVIYKKTGVAID
jgi:2'-phosphotransferase